MHTPGVRCRGHSCRLHLRVKSMVTMVISVMGISSGCFQLDLHVSHCCRMDLEDSYFDCLIRRHVLCRKEMSKGCISASVRYINQAHIVSREHASAILRQLPARLPPTTFLHQWRGEVKHVNTTLQVAHAKTLLHVRCGLHSLVACRLATWIRDEFLLVQALESDMKEVLLKIENDQSFPSLARVKDVIRKIHNKSVVTTKNSCSICSGGGWDDGSRWEERNGQFTMVQDFKRQKNELTGAMETYVTKCECIF